MENLKLACLLFVVISQTQGASVKNPMLQSYMERFGDPCPIYGHAQCIRDSVEPGKECQNDRCSCVINHLETFNGSHFQAFKIFETEKAAKDLSCSSGKCDESTNRCTESVNPASTLKKKGKGSSANLWIFLGIGLGITLLVVGSVIYYSKKLGK